MLQKFLDSEFALRIATFAFDYRRRFFVGLICLLIVYVFACLLSYGSLDPSWSYLSTQTNDIINIGGASGAWLADMLYFLTGYGAWALLLWLSYEAFCAYQERVHSMMPVRFLAYLFMWVCLCVLLAGVFDDGGVIGYEFYTALVALLGSFGAMAFALVGFLLVGFLVVDNEQIFAKKQSKPKAQSPKPKPSPPTPKPITQAPIVSTPKVARLKKHHLHSFLSESGIKAEIQKEQEQSQLTKNPSTDGQWATQPQGQIKTNNGDVLASDVADMAYTDEPSADLTIKGLVSPSNANGTQPTPIYSKAADGGDNKQIFGGIDIDSLPIMDEQAGIDGQIGADIQADKISNDVPEIKVSDRDDGADTAHTPFAMPSTTLSTKPSASNGQTPNAPKPDIHDDKTYQTQSYAMQTALYRQSLPPLPSTDLLDPKPPKSVGYSPTQLQQLSELLQIKLKEFNITAKVMNVLQGPIVTSFEVELAAGIKASKVTNISQDLARSLSMASLRVVEVIAGKPYIGIEIPNQSKQTVKLIELLQSPDYQDPTVDIAMAMGKDIGGRVVITDLAKAPHMLVAGTTGSGKSVLVNAMLLSMLLKYTPDELRLILIDPKMLELANYGDIPHLLTPVVTDMTEAASALSWCVGEMERRYQLMAFFKVRKIAEFNKKVAEAEKAGTPLLDPLWRANDSVSQSSPPKLKTLPLIAVVADEFADMMIQVGKQAEELITRLAQKSRAAGIHLVLATQRPSVDVITGLIKANIPSRAALRVNSRVDSRTILDAGGAEDMLGHGDMLFLAPGKNEPIRVHGAYVTDEEVNRVCDGWRERGAPDYIDTVMAGGDYIDTPKTDTADALYDEALAFIIDSGKTSISALQRKLSIGYNRAANIIESMEQNGVLSAPDNSGKRTLLL